MKADYRGGVSSLYDTQLLATACMYPSAVAAIALRPSRACQTYQSPPEPRHGACRLVCPASFNRGLWAGLLRVLGS